ncbi:hypothetical protein [Aureispira sp. CCB-E]|uniref:hypothetical protein n=1 Tax=Aureispira sp. CCB-E TaxID=3051121 RepID=UPI002868FFD9|nr:hypothetical protein [Aureispira sp. CCB-E]WMX16343.1 hypothetical protein QP953_08190 [Aureispira sp. CCB-E]
MKPKKFTAIIILLPVIVFIGRIVYFEILKKQFISNLEAALKENQTIVIKELTPFEWDELYWAYSDSYGFAGASIGNLWFFYNKDQKVVEINLSSRSPKIWYSEMCNCPQPLKYSEICYTSSSAVFKIVRNNKNGSVNLKSALCKD